MAFGSSSHSRGIAPVGAILIENKGASLGAACWSTFTGTISNGTSGTFANTIKAFPGSIIQNLTNNKLYINTNTKISPTWTIVGTQS